MTNMKEPIIIETLEVWPEDLGVMDWNEAMERVKELGPGWRLPTMEEFETILYPNLRKIPGINRHVYYWSSTEVDDQNAWHFTFFTGYAFTYYNFFMNHVRAVREADVIELLFRDF